MQRTPFVKAEPLGGNASGDAMAVIDLGERVGEAIGWELGEPIAFPDAAELDGFDDIEAAIREMDARRGPEAEGECDGE